MTANATITGSCNQVTSKVRDSMLPAAREIAGKSCERNGSLDVLFAVLPFAEVATPVIAAGLLKAEVARAGFSSRVRYFNLDFAARIGVERYRQVYDEFSARSLLGERIFAEALFEEQLPKAEEYGAKLGAEYPQRRTMIRELLKLRRALR